VLRADCSKRNEAGETALHRLCSSNFVAKRDAALVSALVRGGCDTTLKTYMRGDTALNTAPQSQRHVIATLIEAAKQRKRDDEKNNKVFAATAATAPAVAASSSSSSSGTSRLAQLISGGKRKDVFASMLTKIKLGKKLLGKQDWGKFKRGTLRAKDPDPSTANLFRALDAESTGAIEPLALLRFHRRTHGCECPESILSTLLELQSEQPTRIVARNFQHLARILHMACTKHSMLSWEFQLLDADGLGALSAEQSDLLWEYNRFGSRESRFAEFTRRTQGGKKKQSKKRRLLEAARRRMGCLPEDPSYLAFDTFESNLLALGGVTGLSAKLVNDAAED
jgi:hypothetical protein